MSDPISTSRQARESLARGLNTLQADPTLPPDLIELAAPVAMAMSSLHQVERSGQLLPHVETALTSLRSALTQLQAAQAVHPAVLATLEPVASALSLVHGLGRMANLPPPAARAAEPAPAPEPQPAPVVAAPAPEPQPAPAPVVASAAPNPFAATAPATDFIAAPPVAQAPSPAIVPPAAVPEAPVDAPVITAELGAHSQTNFYKGLAGNDILDHGGLFVSTYMIPKVGTAVRLRVSLPGGYEFEANATVRWTREAGSDAPPGFGAQFTAITPEARQLVYRYVRNREPIFYDDF